jgi:triacylglycerol lipase
VGDARINGLGREIKDTYAYVKDRYGELDVFSCSFLRGSESQGELTLCRDAPKYPVVLAHGLLGFAELKLAGSYLPPIHYWYVA